MEQNKKQKPELPEEQLKEVAGEGYLPERTVATETSNSVVPDGKRQLSDEKLAGVDGGRIPPLPEIPTTTTIL